MAKQPPSKKAYDRQYRKEKMLSIAFRLSRSTDQELIEIYERIPNKAEWFRESLRRWDKENEEMKKHHEMSTIEREQVRVAAAKRVLTGTEYDPYEAQDGTEIYARETEYMSREEAEAFWVNYFEGYLDEMRRSDLDQIKALRADEYTDDEIAEEMQHNRRIRELLKEVE